MARVELSTGGWFDPDKSKLLLDSTAYIDPSQNVSYDYRTPATTLYARGAIRLYATPNGSYILRMPVAYRQNMAIPGTFVPVVVNSWRHDEVGPDAACEYLTRQLEWKKAREWFPAQFSPDLACEWLIREGKSKDAQKNFPDAYRAVASRMQAGER